MDKAGLEPKSLFENVSKGVIGVIKMDLEGKPKGVPVQYKGQVWLTEHEQALTANAPRNDSDNPFLPGAEKLRLITKGSDVGHARPIGDDQDPDAVAVEPEAEELSGDPVDLEPPREETASSPAAPSPPPAGDNEPNPPREEQPAVPPAPPVAGPSSAGAGAEPVDTSRLHRPGPMAHGGGQPVPPTGAPAPKTPDPSE